MLYPYLSVNEKGHLAIADHDTVDLATRYGTALFVMNVDRLVKTAVSTLTP